MARKIYKTINRITSFSIGLVIPPVSKGEKAEKKHVYFEGGITHPRFIASTYIEGEKIWQDALEKSPFYGKKYVLAALLEDEAKPKPIKPIEPVVKEPVVQPESPVKKIPQVKTLQGAITSLVKNGYEGDVEELTDYASIVLAAKSINIEYTKLTE